ncbi:MAG: hypothetical protein GY757_20645 [bacterium]|nr:hypothetical protein [bacterium]
MAKEVNITVENKLLTEKRDMTVYHHSSRSSHMIGSDSTLTIPLKSASEEDYLYISIVRGPGRLESQGLITLPAWADFDFTFEGNVTLSRSGDRTQLKIPPGLPIWQLKLSSSSAARIFDTSDRVTISEEKKEDHGLHE